MKHNKILTRSLQLSFASAIGIISISEKESFKSFLQERMFLLPGGNSINRIVLNENNLTQIDPAKDVSDLDSPRLYSWGNNLNGQLGLGHETKTVASPSLIKFFENIRLKKIDCSQESSLVLTQSGDVYSFGSARSGNLGHDFDISGKNESLPELIYGLENEIINDISISDYHGAAVNNKGELFAWGTLTHGKLGVQKEQLQVKARRERVSNSNIVKEPHKSEYFGSSSGLINAQKVHCSFQTTFIIGNSNIDDKKKLYVLGSKDKGKSGLGGRTRGDVIVPEVISDLPPIEQVSCGRHFCIALAENQSVYSWGHNSSGQLGGSEKFIESKPIKIKSLTNKNIVKVSSGENFALAVSKDGKVYSWGANSVGQLGQNHKSDLKTPKNIDIDERIIDIASGGSHSVILSSN